MKISTTLSIALSLVLSACGNAATTTSGSCNGGAGGNGGGGEGGGEAHGAECESNNDCDQTWTNDCAKYQCVNGFCKDWHLPPDYTCSDDLGSSGQCWGGQCCFTCMADLGDKLGVVDVFDGPCMAGNADTACGLDGQVCQNCEVAGKVCSRGECVVPSCLTSDTCKCTSHYDCPPSGVECVFNACDDGECVAVNLATTINPPLDPNSGLPIGKGCSSTGAAECNADGDCGVSPSVCMVKKCVDGVCLTTPSDAPCPGGQCVDGVCVPY